MRDNLIVTPDDVRERSFFARRGSLFVPQRLAPAPNPTGPSRQVRRQQERKLRKAASHLMKQGVERATLQKAFAGAGVSKPESYFTKTR